jgi:riboflavin kinase/FMN adenylyltransferase
VLARRLHDARLMQLVAEPLPTALEWPHRVEGIVRAGAQRGRSLGFPTANLEVDERTPALDGVYAGWARIDAEAVIRPAMVYVGSAPTFGTGARRLEVHLFDFSGDLYGRCLQVQIGVRVAAGRRYASPRLLAAATRRLAGATREVLGC